MTDPGRNSGHLRPQPRERCCPKLSAITSLNVSRRDGFLYERLCYLFGVPEDVALDGIFYMTGNGVRFFSRPDDTVSDTIPWVKLENNGL
jgi:hypothetical protein